MKIGLYFAMPAEFNALPGAKDLTPFETVSGVPFYHIAPDIIACVGGISKVNAAMAAEILCLKYGVVLILNSGVAGCFTDLPLASLVVASDLVQHDVDTTAAGDPLGLVSTVNRVEFPTWEPERCVALLAQEGFTATLGRVATSDAFLTHGERVQWVWDNFHPVMAEMEACAVAQVCLRNDVKFVALKSVSDHMSAEEYSDFGAALDSQGKAALALANAIQRYAASLEL